MSRLLLDANMPIGLRAVLDQHEVVTAFEMGWGRLINGELLSAAEAAGFDGMITGDRNLAYQQNLIGRRLALIVLDTNHWPTIGANAIAVVRAVAAMRAGGFVTLPFDRPPLRRRPPPQGAS
jgi:hypothetical protein